MLVNNPYSPQDTITFATSFFRSFREAMLQSNSLTKGERDNLEFILQDLEDALFTELISWNEFEHDVLPGISEPIYLMGNDDNIMQEVLTYHPDFVYYKAGHAEMDRMWSEKLDNMLYSIIKKLLPKKGFLAKKEFISELIDKEWTNLKYLLFVLEVRKSHILFITPSKVYSHPDAKYTAKELWFLTLLLPEYEDQISIAASPSLEN